MAVMMRPVPLSKRLIVSPSGGRRARRVRALAGTSDRRRNALDVLGSAVIRVVGTRSLPGEVVWGWPELDPSDLQHQLGSALPGLRIDAAVLPRQPGRARLSLLCHLAGGTATTEVVVKLARSADGIGNEAPALSLLTARPLPGISTPTVLATGELAPGITFLATDGLGLERQRPAIDEPLRRFEHDLADRLAALPRPEGTPPDAVPVHGDLAPWNLRRTGRGLALFDWEAAGWGAPGSDVEYYRRSCAELRAGERRRWVTARRP